jgi:hypothetical protein
MGRGLRSVNQIADFLIFFARRTRRRGGASFPGSRSGPPRHPARRRRMLVQLVQLRGRLPERILVRMQVPNRCHRGGVTQENPHPMDIHASAQKPRREGMAQRMRAQFFFLQSSAKETSVKPPLKGSIADGTHPRLCRVVIIGKNRLGHSFDSARDGNQPDFPPFPADTNRPPGKVAIG